MCAAGSCHNCGGSCGCKDSGIMGALPLSHSYVKIALLVALVALASWGFVEAISGVKAFRYIGAGINPANTISVEGNGKIFAVPDVATFSFTISEDGDDVASAQNKVVAKMDSITDYLKETAGIEDRDIKTTSYNAYPKYEDVVCAPGTACTRSSEIIGYTVSETVTVKVRSTDDAGDVLANIGSRGVDNVSGLSFTVADEEYLQQQARSKAITEARAKAEQLASELGVSLVRVVGFYDNYQPYYYGRDAAMGGETMMSSAPKAANLQLGENTIESNVTITYEIQ